MTERMKKVLERTEETLCRHLEDLNDMVDVDNGRIKDHMTLDGIKDCVKTLKNLSEVMKGNGSASAAKATASAA
jgi:hypothetical protein